MRRISIIILSFVVLLVLFFTLCTFKERPYEKVVLDRFGRVIESPVRIAYGWYLCLPTDKVVRLDTRLHLYQSSMRQIATRNKEPIAVKVFAAWQISEPSLFYRSFKGSDIDAQAFIDGKITSVVANLISNHELVQVFNTDESKVVTGQMESAVTESVNSQVADQGLHVAQVGFSRMAFPPSVARSTYERMTAERMRNAAIYRSEGDSEATKIRAAGDSEATIIRSAADAKAAALRGEGESEAIKILAEAQTSEARDFYRFWRSLELFKSSLGKGTYVVLTPDDPIVAPMFQVPGGKEPVRRAEASK